jgi:hypothetical protein
MKKAFGNAFKQFSFLLVLAFLLTLSVSAQQALTGTWRADANKRTDKPGKINKEEKEDWDEDEIKGDRIYLSFERNNAGGGKSQMGQTYNFSDLQGLNKQQALSGGAVKFSLAREAGTIECEGTFTDGKGTGTFRFTPSMQFVSGMKTRGFDFEKSSSKKGENDLTERVFAAAALNVTTALADDLLSANFGALDVDDLFKAAIFKVDSKFMREMKASGFPNMGMEELVKARIFKIDADFVREVAQMGFDKEPFETLVKMRIFKVTPEFINEVKAEGLQNLDIEDLVKMRIFKIDAAFIRQARAEGVPLDVEKLVQKRIGVWGKD